MILQKEKKFVLYHTHAFVSQILQNIEPVWYLGIGSPTESSGHNKDFCLKFTVQKMCISTVGCPEVLNSGDECMEAFPERGVNGSGCQLVRAVPLDPLRATVMGSHIAGFQEVSAHLLTLPWHSLCMHAAKLS